MQKYWKYTQKNLFSELMSFIGKLTQENLNKQIEYLKVENEILRKRAGTRILPTPIERRKLLRFGIPLGKEIKSIITIVRYETFLLWARGYKWKRKTEGINKRGRPKTDTEIQELIIRMTNENSWGYTRILGELKKLNIKNLSRNTVKNILKKHGLDPLGIRGGDTWNNLLSRHFQTLWACDFFTKQVLTPLGPKMFFVLFFINIKTRKVHITGLTPYPNHEWVNEQTRLLLPSLNDGRKVKKILIRDRDTKYSKKFDEAFEKEGFTIQKTPFMSPNMNAHAESWVGTVKRECLNRFAVFGEHHLRYLISEYVQYYNSTRPHSPMDNRPLEYRSEKTAGKIKCQTKLGGIIKHYYRG
jgi:putative transposase